MQFDENLFDSSYNYFLFLDKYSLLKVIIEL